MRVLSSAQREVKTKISQEILAQVFLQYSGHPNEHCLGFLYIILMTLPYHIADLLSYCYLLLIQTAARTIHHYPAKQHLLTNAV